MKQKPEKLERSTVHIQRSPLVMALVACLLRLRVRQREQMDLRLKGKA